MYQTSHPRDPEWSGDRIRGACVALRSPRLRRKDVTGTKRRDRTLAGWLSQILGLGPNFEFVWTFNLPRYTVDSTHPDDPANPGCLARRGIKSGSNGFGSAIIVVDIIRDPCSVPLPPVPQNPTPPVPQNPGLRPDPTG